jgi:hypothetical protein
MTRKGLFTIILALTGVGFGGCVTEESHTANAPQLPARAAPALPVGHGTALQFRGLVIITDQVANEILNLSNMSDSETTPHILVDPLVNETHFNVNTQMLLGRMRVMLNSKAKNKVRFIDRAMIRHVETQFADIPNVSHESSAASNYHPESIVLESKLIESNIGTRFEFSLHKSSSKEVLWKGSYELSPDFFDLPDYR